jgi:hypothetical protein
MKNIIKSNRLLAEFLGYESIVNNTFINKLPKDFLNHSENYKCFHNDWGWLMQVVEKIESLDLYSRVGIEKHSCKISQNNYFNIEIGRSKIEAVYNSCVVFVKWYNFGGKKLKTVKMKTTITIKNYINLKKELIKRNNLSLIDTTDQSNGYPSNTATAIVGFNTLESAENFAKKYGLSTETLHRRDGWNFWARVNNMPYKPLEGVRGGKVMGYSYDTHNYVIGVNCFN